MAWSLSTLAQPASAAQTSGQVTVAVGFGRRRRHGLALSGRRAPVAGVALQLADQRIAARQSTGLGRRASAGRRRPRHSAIGGPGRLAAGSAANALDRPATGRPARRGIGGSWTPFQDAARVGPGKLEGACTWQARRSVSVLAGGTARRVRPPVPCRGARRGQRLGASVLASALRLARSSIAPWQTSHSVQAQRRRPAGIASAAAAPWQGAMTGACRSRAGASSGWPSRAAAAARAAATVRAERSDAIERFTFEA